MNRHKPRNPLGISHQKWKMLQEKYGAELTGIIERCAYELAVSQDISFDIADRFVRQRAEVFELCPSRLSYALLYVLSAAESGPVDRNSEFGESVMECQGSTCIPKSAAYGYIESLLRLDEGTIDIKILDSVIKHLALKGRISVNRVGDQIFLARKNSYLCEKKAADRVNELLAMPGIISDTDTDKRKMYKAIEAAMAETGKILSQEQKNAVCMVMQNRFSILTGGPGTGKSMTQKVMIQTFLNLKPGATVRCIAPTGQAANRLHEATGHPASTLHAALGIIPGEEKEARTLFDDLILVDEASMMDVRIFSELITHISDKSVIVLIGDTAQLPSIAAGDGLQCLINADSVPTTCLTKIFRQGDNSIAFNCAKIKAGISEMEEDASFRFIECQSSEEIAKEVCRVYSEKVNERGIDAVCCLSPYRNLTKTGVNELNRSIRKNLKDIRNLPFVENGKTRIYEGDKVTFLKNRFGLINGDMGTAVSCLGNSCTVRFGEAVYTFSGEELSYLDAAFAQTVHKAQGMEYETCIIVCDLAHSDFMTRNLFYTALSRAKRECICIGSKKAMHKAIANNTALSRTCCLGLMFAQKSKKYF